jgi:hypothetical protein
MSGEPAVEDLDTISRLSIRRGFFKLFDSSMIVGGGFLGHLVVAVCEKVFEFNEQIESAKLKSPNSTFRIVEVNCRVVPKVSSMGRSSQGPASEFEQIDKARDRGKLRTFLQFICSRKTRPVHGIQ